MTNTEELAQLTIESVSQIGIRTAAEIRKIADSVERRAKRVADHIRDLADAVEERATQAEGVVTAYCQESTDVAQSIQDIKDMLVNGKPKAVTTEPVANIFTRIPDRYVSQVGQVGNGEVKAESPSSEPQNSAGRE
jgi:hypothetical protein